MAKNNKDGIGQWVLALLRVVLGIIFLYHGYVKLFVPGGFKGTVAFFTSLAIPAPVYAAFLVSAVEFVGGILLVLGFLTRLVCIALIIEMAVAFFKVHLKQGFFITQSTYGYEFVVLLAASLLLVLTSGSGNFSVGKLFKNKYLH